MSAYAAMPVLSSFRPRRDDLRRDGEAIASPIRQLRRSIH
jgi:hypothetical protein